MPVFDIRERFSVAVNAPTDLVYRVATEFDMQSPWLVSSILWMRALMLGSAARDRPASKLIEEMQGIGWGCLLERKGEVFVAGAFCRPWLADVVFSPLDSRQFPAFDEPGNVKIAWTMETESLGLARTRLTTETRAVATDEEARRRFRRYWRWARYGIIMIRGVMLPAIRRAAEREWRLR